MLRRGKYDGFNDQHFTEKPAEVEGQMILWDGSEHDWLEGRGPRLCLMGAIGKTD